MLGLEPGWLVFLPHPMLIRTEEEVVRLARETAERVSDLLVGRAGLGGPVTFEL
jgi:hypothetical protein